MNPKTASMLTTLRHPRVCVEHLLPNPVPIDPDRARGTITAEIAVLTTPTAIHTPTQPSQVPGSAKS